MGVRPPVDESPTRGILPEALNLKAHDRYNIWHKLHNFFGKDDRRQSPIRFPEASQWGNDQQRDGRRDSSSRRVGVGLPRRGTFHRQNSERRDRLLPVHPDHAERRAMSTPRHVSLNLMRPRSRSSPAPSNPARTSAPTLSQTWELDQPTSKLDQFPAFTEPISPIHLDSESQPDYLRPPRPSSRTSSDDYDRERFPDLDERAQLNAELDSKWILNLSMHFRDKSDREKFFVTYAEQPNRWRRVTVSCDYRNAEAGSLEMDLKELKFQRDKSFQIYESIRDSLADIKFYDTVTNLKLETSEGRLHVHVTEDVNEIIPYPPKTTVAHIIEDQQFSPMDVVESDLVFESHLSGFVYKVTYKDKTYIKKEIPGPDTVDEFLYELNALHSLHGSKHVIQLEAIVVDDSQQSVKGLLISYAERGAIVDLLYDRKGEISWDDRVRWAQQAVEGLSEIHAEGYVQGDFTLSNIVVDEHNNAQIIDINRRGCPVGWEPPEIAKKIASNQRISMYIGEKSDIYQLGMTLWALAMDDDEPERHDPPLSTDQFPSEVPEWYQDVVRICLAAEPRNRLSAKEVLELFQSASAIPERPALLTKLSSSGRTEREYIDPAAAVERDDIERLSRPQPYPEELAYTSQSSVNDYTFTYPRSSSYDFESGSSQIEKPRGRRPDANQGDFHDDLKLDPIIPEFSLDACDPELQITAQSSGMNHESNIDAQDDIDSETRTAMSRQFVDQQVQERGSSHTLFSDPLHEIRDFYRHTDPVNDNKEIELDSPIKSDASSGTSSSTPRNKQSILTTSAERVPGGLVLEMPNSDLVGLGGHPELEQHSPHEPKTCAYITFDEPTGASHSTNMPPSLPFSDSGYDEPIHFPEHPGWTAHPEAIISNFQDETCELDVQRNNGSSMHPVLNKEAVIPSPQTENHVQHSNGFSVEAAPAATDVVSTAVDAAPKATETAPTATEAAHTAIDSVLSTNPRTSEEVTSETISLEPPAPAFTTTNPKEHSSIPVEVYPSLNETTTTTAAETENPLSSQETIRFIDQPEELPSHD